jgi:hypothetical protein
MPYRARGPAPRWPIALVLALLQAALAFVAVPAAHGAGFGTVTIVADVSAREPASPGVNATARFSIVLARTAPGTVTVDYQTVGGTATAGLDYGTASGTLIFSGSETTKTVAVNVFYDPFDEPDETFSLHLVSAGNATVGSPATRTATIHDANANPTLKVSDPSVAENDPSGVARFVVTLSAPSANTVTVNAATADSTATVAGGDYVALPSTLVTFAPGEVAKVIPVMVNDDSTTEGTESFKLNLSTPSGATVADSQGVATILDDDGPPVISIDDAPAVIEGDSGTVNAVFTIRLSHPSASAVTVKADTAAGTATSPADYAAVSNATVTITAGQTTATLNVPVKGDGLSEANETFAVNLSAPGGGVLGDSAGVGTITDDDTPVQIAVTGGGDVVEGNVGSGGTAAFDVTLSRSSGQTVMVDYATTGGTAISGLDYSPILLQTLTFSPGTTKQTVNVQIVGETLSEGQETFTLGLSNPSGGGLDVAHTTATATILNDDGPAATVTIATPAAPTVESNGTAAVDVTLSNSALPVVATWKTVDGTATAGSDYTATTGIVTFLTNGTQTITVPVTNDSLDENDEAFSVVLTSVTDAIGAGASAIVTIADDDATPTLAVSGTPVNEGNAGDVTQVSVTVTLSAPSGRTVTVDHATTAVTATAGADYTAAAPGTLTFLPGQTSKTLTVEVLGDNVDEIDETLSVVLSNAVNAGISSGTGTVTITDDDTAPAVSVAGAVAVGENDGRPAAFVVSLNGPSAKAIDVTVATGDGTATAGSDYTAVPATVLHFAPGGALSQPVDVTVLDDLVADSAPAEHFTLALTSPVNATLDPAADSATATILDDDGPATLSVDPAVPVAEGTTGDTTPAAFHVSLVPASDASVTVDWATGNAGDTATAGSDYTAASGTLTIPAGATGGDVAIDVLGDTTDEIDETFTVTLTNAAGAALSSGGTTLAATGKILDDDQPVLWVEAPAPKAEGASGSSPTRFLVKLSSPSPTPVSVDYATSNGTATAGSDYTAKTGAVTFPANQTTAQAVDVAVLGDTTDELDETFTLTLSNPTGAALATGGLSAASAMIDDDDGPSVSVAGPASSVAEGNSGTVNAVFSVTLSTPSVQTVTVPYATAAGTATSGTDYTATSGTATFTPGQTTQPVTVPVTGDTLNENDETFSLVLSAPVDGTLGTSSAVATIGNDDGSTLAVGDASVIEGDSGNVPATFTVTLAPATTVPVSVNWATENRTATAGSDYTASSGTLSFAAGETTKAVTVQVRGDTTDSVDETFAVKLSGPSATAVLGDAEGTGTIIDDDAPGSLRVDDVTIAEGTGAAEQRSAVFTVRLNPARPRAVTVHYETVDATATSPSDYAATSGTLTFAAGQTTKTVPVPVVPDSKNEANERFVLHLSAPAAATIGDGDGNATITDDDPAGYLLVGGDGSGYPFGGGASVGAAGALPLTKPVVGSASTPTGNGYWMVASDGGVFTVGDARFYGSTGDLKLNKPIVGMAATPTGNGYWMVATDGGIFSFGDARFSGSTGDLKLNKPIVSMTATPTGNGYWFVASDGGVFNFGDANYQGSTGAQILGKPIVAIVAL